MTNLPGRQFSFQQHPAQMVFGGSPVLNPVMSYRLVLSLPIDTGAAKLLVRASVGSLVTGFHMNQLLNECEPFIKLCND